MSIGLLTYHNNYNKGALLQAFCLQELLDEKFSSEVEIVDYRTKSREKALKNKLIASKRPWNARKRLRDRHICESFIKSHLNLSEEMIVTDDYNKSVQWINEKDYDMVVTGSDEIWNVSIDKGLLAKTVLPSRPFPNLYQLGPDISSTKIAYAASANKMSLDDLPNHQLDIFREHIAAYDHISIRDNHTEMMLKELGIGDFHRVPDPTIMHEVPQQRIGHILEENDIRASGKTLGIHGPQNGVFKQICKYYSNRGYQIVSMTGSAYADIELRGEVNPFEYYSMYDEFDLVVTSSFHSTIFSLQHGAPFITIDTSNKYEEVESKTHSLLEEFNMTERYVNSTDGTFDPHKKEELAKTPIDENRVKKQIAQMRNQGQKYLDGIKNEEAV